MNKVKRLLISFFSTALVLLAAGAFPIVSSAKGARDVPAGADVDVANKLIIIKQDNYSLDGYDLSGYWLSIQANNVTIKNCKTGRITADTAGKKGHVITGNTITNPGGNGVVLNKNDNCKVTNNTFSAGVNEAVLMDGVSGCQISDNKMDGVLTQSIWILNCSDCTIKGNTITNNDGNSSILADKCTRLTIDSNNISNSAHYGIVIYNDNGSALNNNIVNNSAAKAAVPNHGDGILIEYSNGVSLTGNTVDGVKSAQMDWGNGIIVGHDNTNITLKKNTVKNAGNHGIQVSYGSFTNILLEDNTVTQSGFVGVSISRGCAADMINNKVYENIGNGIVYDRHEDYNGKVGVQGNLTGNEVYSNTASGIWVSYGIVNLSGNKCHHNASEGIRIEQNSAATIESNTLNDNGSPYGISLWYNSNTSIIGNTIIKSTPDMDGFGIIVEGNSVSTIDQNRIANYGESGIFAASGTTVNVTNNQVGVSGTQGFKQYAYYLCNGNDVAGSHNHLSVEYITNSAVKGGTHRAGARSGVVVNGSMIEVLSNDSGIIEASFAAQPSTDNIVLFTIGPNNNSICINAKPDFVLPGGPAKREDIEAFVERFYTIILDRPSEAAGLKNWTDALVAGTRGGADVAEEFIHSPEYMAKNESDEVYINKLYLAFFNRQPDAAGKAAWMQSLAEGKDRDFILDGFLASEEYRNLCLSYGIKRESTRTFVKRFYTIVLGRSNDQITFAELDNWQNALDSGIYPGSEIAEQFIHSPEYELTPRNDKEYLEILYKAFFNRDMDQGGYQLWSSQLASGRPRDEILHEFLISQEFCNLCAEYGIRPY